MDEALREMIARLKARTRQFARDVRAFAAAVPKSIVTSDDLKQVIRSSGSIAANYVEANDALSARDRLNRMNICRKESSETELWFDVMYLSLSGDLEREKQRLQEEAHALMCIFGAIVRNMRRSTK